MKYLLGLGFFLKEKYRRNPLVRVFIDDTFIDEFYIGENLKSKIQWLSDPSHWIYQEQKKNWIWYNADDNKYSGTDPNKSKHRLLDRHEMDFPKMFKSYIIDQEMLEKSTKLRFEIDNNDTNYTNGFMTKSTLVDMSKIFLIPCKFVNLFKKIEKQSLRLEFNSKIVPSMYCYDKDPEERNYQLIHTLMPTRQRHFEYKDYWEGYPFLFRCNWNGTICDWSENIGGSGVLTVDIKQNENGFITFDHPEIDHPGLYNRTLSQWGFPISEKFFSIADSIDVHKY